MSQLAQTLSRFTGRVVLDQTALAGGFDYDVEFEADPTLLGRGPGGGFPPGAPAPRPAQTGPAGVSIFAAVQQQLGLRLDSRTAPVDVLVVDSAGLPRAGGR
jgi:uncharacterized protein (TIGR03435 family)